MSLNGSCKALSVSNLSNQFVLKGALLFYLWNEHSQTLALPKILGLRRQNLELFAMGRRVLGCW